MQACINGNAKLCEQLLDFGARFNEDNGQDSVPLSLACAHGHARCTELLLRAHANVNGAIKGNTFFTPLMEACFHGHAECARLLLDAQALVSLRLNNQAKGQPTSPLEFAEAGKHQACIQLLTRAESVATYFDTYLKQDAARRLPAPSPTRVLRAHCAPRRVLHTVKGQDQEEFN